MNAHSLVASARRELPFQGLRSAAAIIALALLLALAFQGTRPLFEPDEGRYVDVALEMLSSRDFVTPHLNPEHAHYTKPPLTYWVLATSLATFGQNEWAARLPNALFLVLTAACILWLGSVFLPRAPTFPATVWITMLAPMMFANVITPDTLLAFLETLAMSLCIAALADRRRHDRTRLIIAMWIVWGLAFMTKGPPGLLPLAATVLVLALRRDAERLRALAHPLGIACFVAVGLWWFALTIWRDPSLAVFYVRDEFVNRMFTAKHDRHPQWYGALEVYAPTLLIGALPWWPLALPALRKAPSAVARAFSRTNSASLLDALLVAWFVVPLVVFLLVRSRLATYVLPLFVPLAILTARSAVEWFERWPQFASGAALTVWIVVLVALKSASAALPSDKNARALATALSTKTRLLPETRIVFVETTPAFGMRFYLNREIEGARLRPESQVAYTTTNDTVCRLLAHEQHSMIMLVPRARSGDFASTVRGCPSPPLVSAGTAGRYAIFLTKSSHPHVASR
ncbi:MAG: glycosyltransferase family 39 protein [Steroidobacteraceae bacterium]|nr:glycosyltransferase family 39 protein [Steroidobacteraceae bacterium]